MLLFVAAGTVLCLNADSEDNTAATKIDSCLSGNDPVKTPATFGERFNYQFNDLPSEQRNVAVKGNVIALSEITGSKEYASPNADKGTRYFTNIYTVTLGGNPKTDTIGEGHIDVYTEKTKNLVGKQKTAEEATFDEAIRYNAVKACAVKVMSPEAK